MRLPKLRSRPGSFRTPTGAFARFGVDRHRDHSVATQGVNYPVRSNCEWISLPAESGSRGGRRQGGRIERREHRPERRLTNHQSASYLDRGAQVQVCRLRCCVLERSATRSARRPCPPRHYASPSSPRDERGDSSTPPRPAGPRLQGHNRHRREPRLRFGGCAASARERRSRSAPPLVKAFRRLLPVPASVIEL